MRKFISAVEAKLHAAKNVNGSDTVEKLGMIVAAVVIICLVILAINNLFGSDSGIIHYVTQAVQDKFRAAVNTTQVGTGGVGNIS